MTNFDWTLGGQPGVVSAPNDDVAIVGKRAADMAKTLTKHWHPHLKPLFDEMDESEAAFWKFTCSTPWGMPEWPNEPRVTVIGDAAHSMTPAGGLGANTGRLLREAGGYEPGITAAYEKEMRIYGSSAVHKSYSIAVDVFGIQVDESSPTV
ncbi:hypothetical protein CTA1_1842 [Colletotrichum tanaceti]|uniref:FAD-binding domain-containing protein n=1 Tax=Colletotrichum tanaceti TaxID=1306861 RepID=A0A4U6XAG1_9PEZI|nr:hypothetical protein CTA1_1842 [Colletotrichum tanaceti]